MSIPIEDTLNWYVVHTHNKQEERAGSNLQAWGIGNSESQVACQ